MKVVIMSGISGAGKSTYVKENFPTFRVFSADHYFLNENGEYKFEPNELNLAHQACFRNFTFAINDGIPRIVVDNTNLAAWEISPYLLAASSFGHKVEIIRLNVDVKVAIERNIHGVPAATIKRMARNFHSRDVMPWWNVTEIN